MIESMFSIEAMLRVGGSNTASQKSLRFGSFLDFSGHRVSSCYDFSNPNPSNPKESSGSLFVNFVNKIGKFMSYPVWYPTCVNTFSVCQVAPIGNQMKQ